jgi:tryptophan synthase alpha chain
MNDASENRIDRKFRELRVQNQKAFVAYITAGDPNPQRTPELVWALERAGADVVELGVPFSDPLADGVVNQLSAQRALEAGTTPGGVLEILKAIRTKSQIPLVLYMYFNLIYAFGIERFCLQAHQAGADGLLVLDLPPEESEGTSGVGARLGDGSLRRISLVAPTTPADRLPKILEKATGFVYYVSREGVTGMQQHVATSIGSRVELLRRQTTLPICIGFGISTSEQAREVAGQADGVVVGSALVNRIAEWGHDADLPAKLENFARPLAEAIHAKAT